MSTRATVRLLYKALLAFCPKSMSLRETINLTSLTRFPYDSTMKDSPLTASVHPCLCNSTDYMYFKPISLSIKCEVRHSKLYGRSSLSLTDLAVASMTPDFVKIVFQVNLLFNILLSVLFNTT